MDRQLGAAILHQQGAGRGSVQHGLWEYLPANKLSNSVFDSYDRIVDRCCAAWNWLMDAPDRIRSIAAAPWTKTVTA